MWEAVCLCNAVGQPQLSIKCQLRESGEKTIFTQTNSVF